MSEENLPENLQKNYLEEEVENYRENKIINSKKKYLL